MRCNRGGDEVRCLSWIDSNGLWSDSAINVWPYKNE